MTLAKPLAGGLPIGATLMTQDVADAVEPGDHAATFGAHPVSCAVGIEVFKRLSDSSFLAEVKAAGDHLHARLNSLKDNSAGKIVEVRGQGLIAGAVMNKIASGDLVGAFRDRGILVCVAGPEVVRFLPPLVVGKGDIDRVMDVFEEILATL